MIKKMKNRKKTPIMLLAVLFLSMVLIMPAMAAPDTQRELATIKEQCIALGVDYQTIADYSEKYKGFDAIWMELRVELIKSGLYRPDKARQIASLVEAEQKRRERELSLNNDYYHQKEDEKKTSDLRSLLNGQTIKLYVQSNANGKLSSTVTPKDVANKLEETYNIYIDKKSVNLSEIKSPGTYNFTVTLPDGLTAAMSVEVLPE